MFPEPLAPGSLVDTHCHLALLAERSGEEPAAVVADAAAAGVFRVIDIGLGDDNAEVLARARAIPGVSCTVGWHPHQKRAPTDAELDDMRAMCRDPRVAAVGEIGLDCHWRPGYHEVAIEVQKESLRRMCALALEVGLPVVIHDRDAHDDCLAVLREFPGIRGTMHAFSGDAEHARRCLDLGFHVSVAGPVTYPNAAALREALAVVPLDRLLVETDAPFLPPQPWRGKPNHPAYVVETARRLAEVRGVPVEILAEATRANTFALFGVGRPGPAGG